MKKLLILTIVMDFVISVLSFRLKNQLEETHALKRGFIEPGSCADVQMVDNFDLEKYEGRWYLIRSVNTPYQPGHFCNFHDMKVSGGQSMMTYTSKDDLGNIHKNGPAFISESSTDVDRHGEPIWTMKADFVPDVPYYILDTDYTSYACIYSCLEILGIRAEVFLVDARHPHPKSYVEEQCLKIFNNFGINVSKLIKINHTICSDVYSNSFPSVTSPLLYHPTRSSSDLSNDVVGNHSEEKVKNVKKENRANNNLASVKRNSFALEIKNRVKNGEMEEQQLINEQKLEGGFQKKESNNSSSYVEKKEMAKLEGPKSPDHLQASKSKEISSFLAEELMLNELILKSHLEGETLKLHLNLGSTKRPEKLNLLDREASRAAGFSESHNSSNVIKESRSCLAATLTLLIVLNLISL